VIGLCNESCIEDFIVELAYAAKAFSIIITISIVIFMPCICVYGRVSFQRLYVSVHTQS